MIINSFILGAAGLDLTLGGALSPAVVLLADPTGTTYAGQTTLYQDTGLTTPATATSDPVQGWKDLSGNGRHYLQGTAGLFPLRNVIGTVAAVAFDGTNDNLAANASFAVAQPLTYIAILRRGANDTSVFIVRGAQADSASFYTTSTNLQLYAGSAAAPSVACASGTNAVAVGVFNGAASQLWVNGGAVATGNPGSLGVRNLSAAMVGGGTVAGVGAANVRLGAVLIYPGALSLAQINAIAVPLAALWGITAAAFT